MKDKRNCGSNMSYPIYQTPMMMPPASYPMSYQGVIPANMMGNMIGGISSNTIEQQINNIEQQLNLLDQRVTRLERTNTNSNNNYNKYNDSNYYMV